MYKFVKTSVSYCLRKFIDRCALRLFFARMVKFVLLLYILSVYNLFIYDTSFVSNLEVFNNKYISVLLFSVIVVAGLAIFLFSKWLDISWKHYTVSKIQNCRAISATLKFIIKTIIVQSLVFVSKILITFSYLTPAAVLGLTVFITSLNGISKMITVVCSCGFVLTFITGGITGMILCNRLSLAEYCLYTQSDIRIVDALKQSIYLMDSKCYKLFKYKIYNILLKITGLFIHRNRVIAYAREHFFITDRTTEYARKMHTPRKTVVFYCKDITA